MKRLFSTMLFLVIAIGTYAQAPRLETKRDSVVVFFKVSDNTLYPQYKDNGTRLRALAERMASENLNKAFITSGSSPDGSLLFNTNLTKARSRSVQDYLSDSLGVERSKLVIDNKAVRWNVLEYLVSRSGKPYSDKVLEIISGNSESRRTDLLKALDGGKVWSDLKAEFFPAMRSTFVVLEYEVEVPEEVPAEPRKVVEDIPRVETISSDAEVSGPVAEKPVEKPAETPDEAPSGQPVAEPVVSVAPSALPSPRAWWVKTNLLGWAVFQMNAAAEVELFNHVTFSLPVYYGSFDWFVNTIKFNTLEVRPELRFFLRKNCTGPFAAIHGTLGIYNYALGGEYRYQDHADIDENGRKHFNPAYGGGLTLGWRFPLNIFGTDRWGIEAAIGAAALRLNYDTFYNVKNGNFAETGIKKWYYGIDNISVSLTYRFDSKRRFRR
ncbi:MAG: DUF3575 domain-containing protein [Bacteroidales bacterium]|nr:DUF3575 domain-containing protein [Bacteroidales bacterium]